MSERILREIIDLFKTKEISFRHFTHKTIGTASSDASIIRNTPHNTGAKALILKTKQGEFLQVVVPADKRVSLAKLRAHTGLKKVSLAHPDEVVQLTDCIIGSVPPMAVLWNISMYIDKALLQNKEVVFSSGTLEDSIWASPKDIQEINNAQVFDLVQD